MPRLMVGYLSYLVCTVVDDFMLIWKKETNPGMSKSKHQAAVVHGFLEFGRFSAAVMKGA